MGTGGVEVQSGVLGEVDTPCTRSGYSAKQGAGRGRQGPGGAGEV